MPRVSLLVDLAALLPRQVDLDALLAQAAQQVAQALCVERATIWLVDAETKKLVSRVATPGGEPPPSQPIGQGISGGVAASGQSAFVDDVSHDPRFDCKSDETTGFSTKNTLAVAIRHHTTSPIRGVLQVVNKASAYSQQDVSELEALAQQLADVLSLTSLRAESVDEIGITRRGRFNRVIGNSPQMAAVYERISLVAETEATVLLTGETGTGKGVLARAVHDNSPRSAGPFVTVDATNLPRELIESELFGHERGAFTGAARRSIGKVERAQGGTLFIDEIGELPLELQSKLLRLLQERSFERVGGGATIDADVRVVCATHRDLPESIEAGRFREDLYYRIRVVQVDVPPLRSRGAEEMSLLARHFARVYADRHGRQLLPFPPELTQHLATHSWPGNVRELEHWVESCVVLRQDLSAELPGVHVGKSALSSVDVAEVSRDTQRSPAGRMSALELPLGLTLDEAATRYVEATLEQVDGNKAEAARRLDIGRNRVARFLKKEE